MDLSSVGLVVTEKNRFKYNEGSLIWVTLVKKSKAKVVLRYLSTVIVSLGKTYEERIKFKKNQLFKNKSHLNALGS